MTNSTPNAFAHKSPARAFSIIELLVVLAIVSVLSSLALVGFNSVTQGFGVRGASDLAASLALSARTEAMSLGRGSMLVVDNSSQNDRKLQRMAVLRGVDGTNGAKTWEMVGSPVSLPRGVYFLPEYSKGWVQTNLPGFPGAATTDVYAFEFDGVGRIVNVGRMVFSGGLMQNGTLSTPDKLLAGRVGFQLFKNGRAAFFQKAEDMPQNP